MKLKELFKLPATRKAEEEAARAASLLEEAKRLAEEHEREANKPQ